MKIPEHNIPEGVPPTIRKVQEVDPAKVGPHVPSGGSPPSDRVEVSQRARELHLARAELLRQPEIREALVADLKQRIQEGTFKVDGQRVAEKLFREIDLG